MGTENPHRIPLPKFWNKHVRALLGHSDISITDRVYAHLSPAEVHAAVGAWNGNRNGATVSR